MTRPKSEHGKTLPTSTTPDFVEAWEQYRANNPLPLPTGLKADKAFFDSLYEDEPGDGQFQFTDLA